MQRGDWIILRTNGKSTLRLAGSLTDAGYDVWTPILMRRVRKRRANITIEREAPITPTFVFARADHLSELVALSQARVKEQPDFSVMRYYGVHPQIEDSALDALRDAQDRAARRKKPLKPGHGEPFGEGDPVDVKSGIASGMSGVVKRSNGKLTLVLFGKMEIEFSTSKLRADNAYTPEAQSGTAAQAA